MNTWYYIHTFDGKTGKNSNFGRTCKNKKVLNWHLNIYVHKPLRETKHFHHCSSLFWTKKSFLNYVGQIWPIIEHLHIFGPRLTFVREFIYSCKEKSAYHLPFQSTYLSRLVKVVTEQPPNINKNRTSTAQRCILPVYFPVDLLLAK